MSVQKIFSSSNIDGSFTTVISNSFLSLSHKNAIAADMIVFGIISGDFLFYIDNACCVSSESPR